MTSHKWSTYAALSGLALSIWLFSPVLPSFAQSPGTPCWGFGPWMMGGAWGWIGGIMMLLFWGLVLIGMVLFVRWLFAAGGSRQNLPAGPSDSPLDILKKRYALGEITREQYELMRREVE